MDYIRNLLSTEPAVIISVVSAAISMAVAFGAPISDAQTASIVQAVATLFAFAQVLLGVAIRSAVYSPATHDEDVAAAAASS